MAKNEDFNFDSFDSDGFDDDFDSGGSDDSSNDFGGFGGFDGFGDAIGWFAAYRVSSYEEEIKVLSEWLTQRLDFLDRNIDRFDKDFEPHIQELKEKTMPQFNAFPFFQ